MKNGAATNVWARTTATTVNGISMPNTAERLADDPASTEDEQQRQAGDRRRQDDRQVDDRLDQPLPAERRDAPGRTPAAGRGRRSRTRLTAVVTRLSAQGGEDDLGRRGLGERAARDGPDDEDRDRQPQEQREERWRRAGRRRRPSHAVGADRRRPGDAAGRSPARSVTVRRQEPEARRGSPGRPARRASRGTRAPRRRSATP